MSKILMIGDVPPPMGSSEKIEASHYRTWQFVQPLIDDQHTIQLVARPSTGAVSIPSEWKDFLFYHPVDSRNLGWRKQLQNIHDQFQPDCVVAVNYRPSLYATRLKTKAPIWMDIYGDQLTIMQLTFFRHSNNRGLHTTVGYMHDILQKGDIFSGCGAPQEHMLVGELAMTGRLNSYTMGFPFTRVVLPGAPPVNTKPPEKKIRPQLEQLGIAEDDFVILWCGGYNAWTDVDVLFAALEKAMAAEKRIHYVSIGESTYPSPDNMYNQLKQKIEDSAYRERYHLLGWMPWDSLGDYYQESNVGINIDGLHYETIYGTRTRLLEMMAKGLPIVTSEGTELSYLLRDKGLALTFASGNWEQFGEHMVSLARERDRYRAMADCAYRSAQGEFSFYETTAPLRAWVIQPQKAPDRQTLDRPVKVREAKNRGRAVLRSLMWRFLDKS
jgi:glycosyltransferase involved in cell wall biosynthesis